ncbi:unnamed protein product [Effrenium voratum]|nr:unnamed protein product [Effrenium voratum]
MRPTTPAWLQGVVRAITPLRNELSGVLECDDDGPGKISEFALAQSPETESTPSPWPWQPKVEEVLGRRPSMPVPSPFSRASTGTPCSFLAQGQRCRAGSVASVPEEATRACLPAIRIPSPDVDAVSQAMGARGQEVPKLPETPELEPVAPTELKGPRMDRWLRPVTPLEGRASAAQEHGGEAAKPGPDEGPSSRRSSPERGSRPSTARPASRPVSGTPRASERRAEASAYIHAVAAAQRLKVEGPRTSRGTRTPEMPQIRASDAKRESEASVAMAATVAQQQLMAKLNPGLQSKGKARAKVQRGGSTS